MTTRHGKILSKSFPATMKGEGMRNQQVLVGRRVGTVAEYLPQTQSYKVKFLDDQTPYENYFRFDQLFSLTIQYRVSLDNPKRNGNIIATARLEHIPVKWSQWHQAIAHKEVDNAKQVRFETRTLLTIAGEITIGKIIPSRIRTYSADDVVVIIDDVTQLCQQFGFELEIEEANSALEELKAKYVE